jgi:flagellar protein FliS
MNTYSPAKDVYLQNLVENANPIRLVILLYDKAINSIDEAICTIEEGLEDNLENVKRKVLGYLFPLILIK